MPLRIVTSPDYEKNRDAQAHTRNRRLARLSSGAYPCIVCGRFVVNVRYSVHLHGGGCIVVTEEEAAALNQTSEVAGDMYFYPIGPDCLRSHPEYRPYVHATTEKNR